VFCFYCHTNNGAAVLLCMHFLQMPLLCMHLLCIVMGPGHLLCIAITSQCLKLNIICTYFVPTCLLCITMPLFRRLPAFRIWSQIGSSCFSCPATGPKNRLVSVSFKVATLPSFLPSPRTALLPGGHTASSLSLSPS
jgi:hypothetical protein